MKGEPSSWILGLDGFDALLAALRDLGYRIIGPRCAMESAVETVIAEAG